VHRTDRTSVVCKKILGPALEQEYAKPDLTISATLDNVATRLRDALLLR
jgi:hypothetical protein